MSWRDGATPVWCAGAGLKMVSVLDVKAALFHSVLRCSVLPRLCSPELGGSPVSLNPSCPGLFQVPHGFVQVAVTTNFDTKQHAGGQFSPDQIEYLLGNAILVIEQRMTTTPTRVKPLMLCR